MTTDGYKSEADRNVRRAFIENCRDLGRDHIIDVRHMGPRTWWWYTKRLLLAALIGLAATGILYALIERATRAAVVG